MSDTAQADDRQSLVLVDAHALVHQLFHAIAPMTAPDGRPTNVIFGFARDLFYFRDELRPDYLIYVFDMPGPTFRDRLVTDYKAHRKPPDDDLIAQIAPIQEMLTAAHVPVLGQAGFEADDLIATIATAGAERGLDVVICTSDKDCRQLIGDHIRMLNLRKRTFLDRAALFADWGVTPEQAVDFQTLVGDTVDNVKGVKGVGEKTAAKLLQKFGSLDGIVANLDQLTGVVSAKIQASLKEAVATKALDLGRQLVRLETKVPMSLDWDGWRHRDWDTAKLLAMFQNWGFRSFAGRLRGAAVPAPAEAGGPHQGDLFAGVPEPVEPVEGGPFPFGANAPATPAPAWHGDYQLIATPAALKSFLKDLKKQARFTVDLETTGLDPHTADLVGVAISWQAGTGYYLAVRGPQGEDVLDETELLAALKPVLENPAVAKINQNIKFDQNVFRHLGIRLQGVVGDSMLADYLLHSGERSHGLDELALRYFQHENIHIEELIGKKGKNQKTMAEVGTALVARYAGEDADVAWRLCELLEPELSQEGLRALYDELEVPLIEVLADLEYTGIRLDVPFLARLSTEMADQLEGIERDIYKLAGRQFNIASPKQLAQVLFDELKLPVQRKTDLTGAASTNQETLEKLAALGHELPRRITEHRQISKLKGTYVDALPALVNSHTGRVHTGFNQAVAATGRLSSSEPNLQNIPARTEQGKQIRQCFLPQEGWVLLTADYSQVELRILAHFCGDAVLRQAFAEDRDIHATVAAQIYNVAEEAVTSAQRRVAKTVNFGVLYGMSPAGLAQRLGMPREEAVRFIDAYFARYPLVLAYQQRVLMKCRTDGYGTTILGRRRKFDKESIRAHSSYQNRNQAEREAINMEIQGSAADLMKRAMLHVYRRLHTEKRAARMLLTVHDELVFEVPPTELADVAALVRAEMVGAMTLDVPLKVDVAAGPNWLDVQDVP